jgi:hypothetical protein
MVAITLADATAQFGTNLAPDGSASDSSEVGGVSVDGTTPSAGACYEWTSTVTVTATVPYDVTVTAAAANTVLDFLVADPTTYAACTSGEAVGTSMFPSASPPRSWVRAQTATSSRTHRYWLGLDVRWTTLPTATLGNAALTFAIAADW